MKSIEKNIQQRRCSENQKNTLNTAIEWMPQYSVKVGDIDSGKLPENYQGFISASSLAPDRKSERRRSARLLSFATFLAHFVVTLYHGLIRRH
ncbi:hypothetical protein BLAT2472_120169 [Burkholderia latens]